MQHLGYVQIDTIHVIERSHHHIACPVLAANQIVAALDLKTDREQRRLLVQKWTWIGGSPARRHKRAIEEALHAFERFQLAATAP